MRSTGHVAGLALALCLAGTLPAAAAEADGAEQTGVSFALAPDVGPASNRIIIGQTKKYTVTYWCYLNGKYVDDVVHPTVSGEPSGNGEKPPVFDPTTVHTNPPSSDHTVVTLSTTLKTTPKAYPLTFSGHGSVCGTYAPGYLTLVVAPKISGPAEVWWFKDEHPPGWKTKITFTALPAGQPSYTYRIKAGTVRFVANKGQSYTTSSNTAEIEGTAGSRSLNDVQVIVSVKGIASDPAKTTVRKPYELRAIGPVDVIDATFAYTTWIHYEIRDQFHKPLPAMNVPLHEKFTSVKMLDFPHTDWQTGIVNGGNSLPAQDWTDRVDGDAVGFIFHPTPQHPQTPRGATRILHWGGYWAVGSASVAGDLGVHVQNNTWQKYRDHGRHEHIKSPP